MIEDNKSIINDNKVSEKTKLIHDYTKQIFTKIFTWDNNGTSNTILWIVIIGFFTTSLGFTILETMATPIMSDQLGIDVGNSWLIFVIGGIANVIALTLQTIALQKEWVNNRHLSIFSFILSMLGCLVLVDWKYIQYDDCNGFKTMTQCISETYCIWNQDGIFGPCNDCEPICHNPDKVINVYQLYIGFAIINMAFPPGRITTAAIYSQLLGKKKQGFMQSILVCFGSLSRIIGPLIAIGLYVFVGHKTFLLMFILSIWFGLCSSLFIFLYKRMDYLYYNTHIDENSGV
jgi:MFS family permease